MTADARPGPDTPGPHDTGPHDIDPAPASPRHPGPATAPPPSGPRSPGSPETGPHPAGSWTPDPTGVTPTNPGAQNAEQPPSTDGWNAGPQHADAPDGQPGTRAGSAGGGEEPRKRLHPLSPLLSGAKSIAVVVAALSWQTLSQVGFERFVIVVAVCAVGVVIFSVVGWLNTGYHVVGRELRIQDGLLWRRQRAIPLDRLQSVELRRPLLARLTGLAELRLEVVGGGKTEAPLAYVTVREAGELRTRLLALAGRTPGSGERGTEPAAGAVSAPAPERPVWRVSIGDLVVSQLLTPQAFFLPLGVAFVVMQFVLDGSWTFIGIASTMTAMAGVLLQPVRRVLRDWNFRLSRDHAGRLAVRYGLVETRSQVVPLNRVQSVAVTWPYLWRRKGWLQLRLHIAGVVAADNDGDGGADRLLPVGVFEAGRLLVWEVLPGVDLAALPTVPAPRRARWLSPVAWRGLGVAMTAEVFVSRSGVVTRQMLMVPYARIQSVRVVQGPVQRRLGLATVYADTAGGSAGVAKDRDLAEAWWLADQLAARARHARTPRPLATAAVAPATAAPGPAAPLAGVPALPPAGPADATGPGDGDAMWRRPANG